ncbi:MAG TPA: carboxypeptidase regulatory-like domain-containing protein [Alphaproteobacteria bacterium]|jgi:hypothetical protein|nr:carboxypeptidase regulatory-like domain-containing protein [Alphaproteobacteria bacterium]
MRKLIATLSFVFCFLVIFPIVALAATNYGDGTYGGGLYGVGDTPVPASTTTTTTGSTNSAGASQCTNTTPSGSAPWLYSASANSGNSITLRFANYQAPVDHFVLEYGTESNKYTFGVSSFGNKDTNSYTVNSLSSNTKYYFRVRAGNGCATGTWSNELSTKTLKIFSINNLNITNTEIEPVSSQATPKSTSKTEGPTETVAMADRYKVNIKVKDTKGNPIENATITLHSTPQTIKTDKDGMATFTNVESGDHTLFIAYNNYQGEQSINLTGDVKEFNINITIEQKPLYLSPLAIGIIVILVLIVVFLTFKLIKKNKISKI